MDDLKGWLVVFNVDGEEIGEYSLFPGKNIVGSSPEAKIFIGEDGIEKFHFSIRIDDNEVYIVDLDSNSGLYSEGERFFRREVKDEFGFKTAGYIFIVKLI